MDEGKSIMESVPTSTSMVGPDGASSGYPIYTFISSGYVSVSFVVEVAVVVLLVVVLVVE